jgi:hypothetical protein
VGGLPNGGPFGSDRLTEATSNCGLGGGLAEQHGCGGYAQKCDSPDAVHVRPPPGFRLGRGLGSFGVYSSIRVGEGPVDVITQVREALVHAAFKIGQAPESD